MKTRKKVSKWHEEGCFEIVKSVKELYEMSLKQLLKIIYLWDYSYKCPL